MPTASDSGQSPTARSHADQYDIVALKLGGVRNSGNCEVLGLFPRGGTMRPVMR